MDHKGILSSAFNMSLGFIPVIISILLCELITQDTAIYIGTGIGIIGIYLSYRRKGLLIPNFILYIATGVLALLSVAALIPGDYVPPGALPLTLEVSILIPMLSQCEQIQRRLLLPEHINVCCKNLSVLRSG